jgi:flagellar secretion chaperone FliS
MAQPYGAQSYLQTQVQSADPMQLVVLLYDGALRQATIAHDAMVRRDIPTRRTAIGKALAIVAELHDSVDLERGGKLSADLDGLYIYVTNRMLDAVVQQDPKPIAEAIGILTTLRDAWQQIATQGAAQQTGARP